MRFTVSKIRTVIFCKMLSEILSRFSLKDLFITTFFIQKKKHRTVTPRLTKRSTSFEIQFVIRYDKFPEFQVLFHSFRSIYSFAEKLLYRKNVSLRYLSFKKRRRIAMSQLTEQRDWPVPNFNLAFPARNLYKFASPLRRGCEASAISSPRRDVDEDQHMEGVMAETRAWTVERVEKRHIFQSSRFERTRVSNEFSMSLRAKNEDGEKYTGGYIVILRGRRPTCVKTYPINSMYLLAKLRTTDRVQSEHQQGRNNWDTGQVPRKSLHNIASQAAATRSVKGLFRIVNIVRVV